MVAFCSNTTGALKAADHERAALLGRMKTALAEMEGSRTALTNEIESVLQAARSVAAEVGVSQQASVFEHEASNHETSGFRWLIATAVLLGITLFAVGCSLYYAITYPKDYTPNQAVQVGIGKVALFSVLFTFVIWAGRTYKAHRHNAVVNRHRSNALRVFDIFVKAAADDATKNAVLIQATQSIFSPQQTGYVSGDGEAQTASPFVEIIKGSISAKG